MRTERFGLNAGFKYPGGLYPFYDSTPPKYSLSSVGGFLKG
jgi:hypothetical protein